jgi:hypothetical protein
MMRRVISSVAAALLPLLMVLSSVSAAACDLRCSLHQAYADCHTPSSSSTAASKDDTKMSGMDMGPNRVESTTGSDTGINAAPSHSMSMSPQLAVATGRFEQTSQSETGRNSMPNQSRTGSSCTHGTCGQIATSTSPLNANHSQHASPHLLAISVSIPVSLGFDFHWIKPESSPPKILASDRFVTTLRI